MIVVKIIYRSCLNLIYYRREREIDIDQLREIKGTNDVKRQITDAFLSAVGLRTVSDEEETVPRYILLSRVQRDWIKIASQYGYRIGLK